MIHLVTEAGLKQIFFCASGTENLKLCTWMSLQGASVRKASLSAWTLRIIDKLECKYQLQLCSNMVALPPKLPEVIR